MQKYISPTKFLFHAKNTNYSSPMASSEYDMTLYKQFWKCYILLHIFISSLLFTYKFKYSGNNVNDYITYPRYNYFPFPKCVRYWHLNVNTWELKQNGCHTASEVFDRKINILIQFAQKYVVNGPIDNGSTVVQIVAEDRT